MSGVGHQFEYQSPKFVPFTGAESEFTPNLQAKKFRGFPGGTVVKNLPANAGDMGSRPGPGRSHMAWSN